MPTEEDLVAISLKLNFAQVLMQVTVAGILIFMSLHCLSAYLATSPKTRRGLATYVGISFAITILWIISKLVGDGLYIWKMLYECSNDVERGALNKKLIKSWWLNADFVCYVLLSWIGDGLLVYRCYVIWVEKRWVTIIPALVYIGSMATSLMWLITQSRRDLVTFQAQIAWIALNIAVSCLVTLLISYKIFVTRKELARAIPGYSSSAYSGAVSILVESAAPLTLAGLLLACVYTTSTVNGIIVTGVFYPFWVCFNAISPQMIIFRVMMGRSWSHQSPLTGSITRLTSVTLPMGKRNTSTNAPEATDSEDVKGSAKDDSDLEGIQISVMQARRLQVV